MEDLRAALLALQNMDDEIAAAKARMKSFVPRMTELEQPVASLSQEIEASRARVADLRRDVQRLEKAAEQKLERLAAYEERLQRVRNLREESAARVEMDLVRRASEADLAESVALREQVTRTELKLVDQELKLNRLRDENAPALAALIAEKEGADSALAILEDRRQNHAVRIDRAALRLYERVRAGRSTMALAPMTAESACGNCFNILPLQEQSEVREGRSLFRCEGCGVILYVR